MNVRVILTLLPLLNASPLGEGCIGERPFLQRLASFSVAQHRAEVEYCINGVADSTSYEIHVSVPAWSPVNTFLTLLWRHDVPVAAPPGGRARSPSPHSSSNGTTLTLVESAEEKLIFGSDLRLQTGVNGTLYVKVEFERRGAALVPLLGVPYNIRLEPILWGVLPRIILQGLALPLLSSFLITALAVVLVLKSSMNCS